jgi:hypothetical protein
MSPRHDTIDWAGAEVSSMAAVLQGTVESVSTRVLLNGGVRECRACGATIASGTRYRCLTVRDADGTVSKVWFCGDDCADALADDRVASR